MPSKTRVLVTGASGFLGAQVVDHLLQAGYAVRGTSRSPKAEQLRRNYSNPDFDVAVIDDLVAGDFSAALQDVSAVIHVASPLASGTNHLKIAIEGTMNILRQAHAAGVYKVTLVSSYAAAFTTAEEMAVASRVVTDSDWNKVTIDEALKPDIPPMKSYTASKALAERAAWDFAKAHPEVDLITLLPPFIYGPLAPAQVVTDPATMLSTNGWLYKLVARPIPSYPGDVLPHAVDVRDVAKAAVLSLKSGPGRPGEKRRILLWGGSFTWRQAVKYLAEARPDLRARLVDGGEPALEEEKVFSSIDTSKAKEVLGLATFISWKKTVEDAIDSMLKRESSWVK